MRKKNNRKPVSGARGLLRLRCKCCGREFGTFLHIPQVSIGCHCGATISLEGLCAYEFDCECCGVHTYGLTNMTDADLTIPCRCGNPITMRWDPSTRRYKE